MKKFIFCTLISALMVLAGCQKSDELVSDIAGKPITVTAHIQGSASSRVVLIPGEDSNQNPIVRVTWRNDESNKETFTVYDSDFNGSIFTQTSDNQFTGISSNGSGSYLAVYGNHVAKNTKITYDFSEQDGVLNDDDFLMMAEGITDLAQPIEFKHKTAILKVTFMLDDQDVDPYITQFTMAGVHTGVEGNSTITVQKEKQDDDIYVFLPIEKVYEANDQFTFNATVADVQCTGSITIPQNITVEAGKIYTANIKLSDTDIVNCYLPTGSVFNAAVKEVLGDNQNVTSIVFETESQETGGTRIGKTRAMAKVVGNTLKIYTVKRKFWFNANSSSMFEGLTTITSIDWDQSFSTGLVGNMNYMFKDCNKLKTINFPETFSVFGVSSMKGMFENCNAIQALYLGNFTLGYYLWDMSNMFKDCTSLTKIEVDPENFKTSAVDDMSSMFEGCSSLTSVPTLQTNWVTNMSNMYKDCTSLTVFNVDWDGDENLNMSGMFDGCYQLTKVAFGSNFKPTATGMSNMFRNCIVLTSIDLRNFTVKESANCENMFSSLCAQSDDQAQIYVTEELKKTLLEKGNTAYGEMYTYAEFNTGTPPAN